MSSRRKIYCTILTILIIIIGCIVINIWMSTNYLVIRNYKVNVSKSLGKTIRTVAIVIYMIINLVLITQN